jgi:Rieske Fe-S protein
MSDEREQGRVDPDETLPSLEQIAALDAYLDRLAGDHHAPVPSSESDDTLAERQLAAQFRLLREDVERPSAAFLQSLEAQVSRAVKHEARARRGSGVSRMGFLRTAVTLAGGAGLGIAGVEGAAALTTPQRPTTLVAAGNERWYDVAAVDEVPPGDARPFTAGGVQGYLLNDGGDLHAVSAICTHMGCKLKPQVEAGEGTLQCLCHGSRFDRHGARLAGLAPSPLPRISVRVENGRVYALGTRETV